MYDTDTLSALARAGALLSDNSFAGTLAIGPALTLQAVPRSCRVELTVTHPDQDEAVRTVAAQPCSRRSAMASATTPLSLDIVLTPEATVGALVVSTDVRGGLGVMERLAVKVMVTQIESALRCAYAVERARHMTQALERGEDIGVAVGLVMASQGLDRLEAFVLVEHLSDVAGRTVVDLAREIISAGTVPSRRRTPLRLVASHGTN